MDEFYEVEEQLAAAHEAYLQAKEASAAQGDGDSDAKPAADGRPAVLAKMDALTDRTLGKADAAPVAMGMPPPTMPLAPRFRSVRLETCIDPPRPRQ